MSLIKVLILYVLLLIPNSVEASYLNRLLKSCIVIPNEINYLEYPYFLFTIPETILGSVFKVRGENCIVKDIFSIIMKIDSYGNSTAVYTSDWSYITYESGNPIVIKLEPGFILLEITNIRTP